MTYTIYRAAGWHGEPTDPVIGETDDRREAAMRAGCRVDLSIPGECNRYDAYVVDEHGERVEPVESYQCDCCEALCGWCGNGSSDGPIGTRDGVVLECPAAWPSHLVTWMCPTCADALDD